ncbi:S41 family peptidase [Paludibaculum fermentans]|uniref:S41 family peptidase n=1 Tax=Paludibaculum fermentans TaxID=1473598 RepID=UPI003EBA46BE
MVIEDARERTAAAIEVLKKSSEGSKLPQLQVTDVPTFFAAAEAPGHRLTLDEKYTIIDQAIMVVDQLYAHLPFKRARYAIDPVQRLRLIRSRLNASTSEVRFHSDMVAALASLRDAHTFYGLPSPFRDAMAFLPFQLRFYFDESGAARFLVTRVLDGFGHKDFDRGAEVTFWNGMPVDSAIGREAELDPSGNEAAQFARALNRLTARSMTFSVPRDERWVTLEYRSAVDPSKEMGILLPWNVISGAAALPTSGKSGSSVYAPQLELEQYRKRFWCQYRLAVEQAAQAGVYGKNSSDAAFVPERSIDDEILSRIPAVFEFQHTGGASGEGTVNPKTLVDPGQPGKRFSYLLIRSFDGDADELVDEFQRILSLLNAHGPDGLILDVRSNPGGSIQAAERMLQMLTPSDIRTAGFHFISTPMTQGIAAQLDPLLGPSQLTLAEWNPWRQDLLASVASGGILTPARQLTPVEDANAVGQVYQGPVLLLIDALSYSAADIFCGGFQDNRIGPIIGVDPNTGGGGANRWLHSEIVARTAGLKDIPLVALPRDATLGLAIRRSSRVGDRAGHPLEDTGVLADELYNQTRNDLLNFDEDLMHFACRRLAAQPAFALRILSVEAQPDHLSVELTAENIDRLEVVVDGLHQGAFSATRGPQTVQVPMSGLPHDPRMVKLLGYILKESEFAASLAAAGLAVPAAQVEDATLVLAASARMSVP